MKINNKFTFISTLSLLEILFVFVYYIFYYSKVSWWNEPKLGGLFVLLALIFFAAFFLVIFNKSRKSQNIINGINKHRKKILILTLTFVTLITASLFLIAKTNSFPTIILFHKINIHEIFVILCLLLLIQSIILLLIKGNYISANNLYKLNNLIKIHERILIAIFLVVLITTFFLPTFVKGKLPINSDYLLNFDPWQTEYSIGDSEVNYVLSDSIDSRIPNRGYFNTSIKNLDFPLWNPNINLGTPYGFQLFTGTFSIANLTTLIAGAAWGTLLYYYLKLFILGYFIYLFLRKKKLNILPSLLGMIVAAFSSYIIVYLGTYVADSVIYIPAIMYFGECYLNSSQYKYFVGLSTTVTLTLLSGFPAITIFSILLTFGYFIFRVMLDNDGTFRQKATKLLYIAAGFIIGLTLSLFSLIPTYEFFEKIDLGYRLGRGNQRLPFETFWRVFNGNICGNPVEGNYFCPSNYNETAVYVGLSPILLLPFSITRKKNFKLAIFFLICLFFIFITVFGFGNFHNFIGNLPVFNLSSNTRMIALLPICTAIIASIGLDNIFEAKKNIKIYFLVISYIFVFSFLILLFRKSNPFFDIYSNFITKKIIYTSFFSITIGMLIYLIIKINNKNFKRIFISIIILFAFLDSTTKLYNYNGASEIKSFFPETPGIYYLKENQKPHERMIPVSRRVMVPGFPLFYSLNSLLGRWWTNPEFRDIVSLIDPGLFDTFVTTQPILELESINLHSPLLELFRIKYIVLPDSDQFSLEKVVLTEQAEFNSNHLFTYPNKYGQTVRVKRDQKVNKLTLKLSSLSPNNDIPVTFKLYIDDVKTIDNTNKLVNFGKNLFELNFHEQYVKKNQEVRIEISPLEISEENRIYYTNFDRYKDGQMMINENPWNGDLAFDLSYYEKNSHEDYDLVYDEEIKIFRNLDYTNTIPIVFSTTVVNEENCTTKLSNIDPEKEALVFNQALNQVEENEKNEGYAKIVEYSNNHVTIFAELSDEGMVVLSDQWFPGWTAKVDGITQEIMKVNCIMRGVVLEEGRHIIEMDYKPKSIFYGILISGSTLILLICFPLLKKFNLLK